MEEKKFRYLVCEDEKFVPSDDFDYFGAKLSHYVFWATNVMDAIRQYRDKYGRFITENKVAKLRVINIDTAPVYCEKTTITHEVVPCT